MPAVDAGIVLDFQGPYTFTNGDRYLFDSGYARSPGIYLWMITDGKTRKKYVHYIGETGSFGKRQREHVVQLTGLNYAILDPESARHGEVKYVWRGLWRDRSSNAVAALISSHDAVCMCVTGYIAMIDVYFAPTDIKASVRKHLEGCLALNVREKGDEISKFYPADNRTFVKRQRLGKKVMIHHDGSIVGLDDSIII
ncbi:MAG: hypothetical protein MUF78_07505 [Candidatus Edwardsbacteria bacterium]|jgi:hypothetical protein|nr:hypothetical protein [Candidatus Edwardsbacteria bacterium]